MESKKGTLIPRSSTDGFPAECTLTSALILQNTRLSFKVASEFADAIIKHNRDKRFDDAWQTMLEALNWNPPPVFDPIHSQSR